MAGKSIWRHELFVAVVGGLVGAIIGLLGAFWIDHRQESRQQHEKLATLIVQYQSACETNTAAILATLTAGKRDETAIEHLQLTLPPVLEAARKLDAVELEIELETQKTVSRSKRFQLRNGDDLALESVGSLFEAPDKREKIGQGLLGKSHQGGPAD